MIQIIDLHKSYRNNHILKGVTLSLEEGLIHGIVGQNGAGKTTLFRCILGLETYVGQIEPTLYQYRNQLGYLPTNPSFLSRITGWEYLKLVCIARGIKEEEFDSQNIFELPLHEYAENYSTGMKKKLALMGILMQKNKFFILDEPYNGVDLQSSILISEVLQLLKAKGKTIILSSHIFTTMSENCDLISVLEEGKITKTVKRENFEQLHEDMKQAVIGDKLRSLNLID